MRIFITMFNWTRWFKLSTRNSFFGVSQPPLHDSGKIDSWKFIIQICVKNSVELELEYWMFSILML